MHMPRKRKPKAASGGDVPITPITAKERRELDKSIKKKYDRFRRRYPEVHNRVVDLADENTAPRRAPVVEGGGHGIPEIATCAPDFKIYLFVVGCARANADSPTGCHP
jgi:hypothetical protein